MKVTKMKNEAETAGCPAGLNIYQYDGEGYNRTMHYGEWRVAILNWCERFDVMYPMAPERHHLTDEVFVLLTGDAVLEVWDSRLPAEDITAAVPVRLEAGKLYSVGADVWHRVTVSRDAKLLIVENHSTGPDNSEYMEGFPTKAETGVKLG